MEYPNLEAKAEFLYSHDRETLMSQLLPIFQTVCTKLRKLKGIFHRDRAQ